MFRQHFPIESDDNSDVEMEEAPADKSNDDMSCSDVEEDHSSNESAEPGSSKASTSQRYETSQEASDGSDFEYIESIMNVAARRAKGKQTKAVDMSDSDSD